MSTNGEFNPTVAAVEDNSIEVHIKFTPPGHFAIVSPKVDLQTTLALLLEAVKASVMSMKHEKPLIEVPGMDIQRRIV